MPNSPIRATVRWGSSLPSALLPRWSRVHQTPINDWRRRTGGMVWLCITSVGAVWLLWTTRNPLSSSSSADCIAIWVWGCVTTALVCGESARSVFDSCRLIMGFMHPAHAVVCINKVKCLALAEMQLLNVCFLYLRASFPSLTTLSLVFLFCEQLNYYSLFSHCTALQWYTTERFENYRPGGYHPVSIGDELHNSRYRILHRLYHGLYSTI